MITIDPKRIVFEDHRDLVDYVTKGFAPRRKDFNEVMNAFRNPAEDDDQIPENGIYLTRSATLDIDPNTFDEVMRRVYENNRKFRNNVLIGAGIGAAAFVGTIIALACSHKRKTDELKSEYESEIAELKEEIDDLESEL